MLAIYLEPTPYILGLIGCLDEIHERDLCVVFVASDVSQSWGIKSGSEYQELPTSVVKSYFYLNSLLKTNRYELIHLAGWGHPLFLATMLLARWFKIPVVVETDTQLPFEISTVKRALKRLLMPLLFRVPAGFLPGGTRQARYLKHYGVPEEKIQIAQMTVDVASMMSFAKAFSNEKRTATRNALGIEIGVPTFLYVGRMEPYKGVIDLITAFNQLRDEGKCCQLLLVGDGSLRKELERISKTNEGVVFAGRLSGEMLLSAYNSTDFFVLPSCFEPWGLVVNEAMAAGLPVIASSRVGCVEDLVMQDSTGLVYEYGSPGGLINTMRIMLKNDQGRKEMGRNAQSLIKNWTLAEEANRVTRMWDQLK